MQVVPITGAYELFEADSVVECVIYYAATLRVLFSSKFIIMSNTGFQRRNKIRQGSYLCRQEGP